MHLSCEEPLPLLYHLIREMVDHPEEVLIRQIDAGRRMVFEVYAHREDVRKVIGTRGRHVDAVRTILTAVAAPMGRMILVDIMEPIAPRPDAAPPPMDPPLTSIEEPPARVAEMLLRLVRAVVHHPGDAEVQVTVGAQVVLLTIKSSDRDVSRIVGRKGRTLTALRSLIHALSGRYGRSFFVDLVDPEAAPISRVSPGGFHALEP